MSAASDFVPVSGRGTNVAGVTVYADIDIRDGMWFHPVRRDIVPTYDINAVKNSVRNLVLSNYHDAPFQPYRGSNITALLFENATPYTAIAINKEITRVLAEYEPRINAIDVQVTDNSDTNSYVITISFNVIALNTIGTVNFYLERLR